MLAGIPAVLNDSAALSLALISLCTFAFSAWAANLLALPSDIFPRTYVATVTGFSGTGAAIGGMLFTLLTGYLVQYYSYTPVFVAAGLLPLVAASLILVLIPRIPDHPPDTLEEVSRSH
jgi:ACS family hexuronate transporter-like MFS transporter